MISREDFTSQHRMFGRVSCWSIFSLILIYAVTTILGFLSLKSPQEQLGDPYFTIMELLIILLAPLMVISMIAINAYAAKEVKVYSFTALVFMIIMAGITSSLHFVVLTVSRQIEAAGLTWAPLLFSFKWPSIVYTLDILAWDWFFAISMLFAAPVFNKGKLEKAVRLIMIITGGLSLVGLLGAPLAIMNVGYWLNIRNIGIIGYALISPAAFLLIAIIFGRTRSISEQATPLLKEASNIDQ